ncbi:ATP-binding cassette domain-containing protein [bacterium]|nr:ATP-binding cassette domain-containing protein [bacterium]
MKIFDRKLLPISYALIAMVASINAIAADLLLAQQLSSVITSSILPKETILISVLILTYSISSSFFNNYVLADITFKRGHYLFKTLLNLYCNAAFKLRNAVDQEALINVLTIQITNICGGLILPLLSMLSSGLIVASLFTYLLIKFKYFILVFLFFFIPASLLLLYTSNKPLKTSGKLRLESSKRLNYELENIKSKSSLTLSLNQSNSFVKHLSISDRIFRNNEKKFLIINSIPNNAIDSIIVLFIFVCAILSNNYPDLFSGSLLASAGFLLLKIVTKVKLLYSNYNKIVSYNPSLIEYNRFIHSLSQNEKVSDSIESNYINSPSSKKANKLFSSRTSLNYLENKFLFDKYKHQIKNNSINLITGPSGVGKSTFLRDYMYSIDSNNSNSETIFIDQYPVTFPWSILCNLSLFSHCSSSQVLNIKKLLSMYNLNSSLFSEDYDLAPTQMLDSQMTKLSGGELQRFCLIRALYKPYDLVLLDEPLSSQDKAMASVLLESITNYSIKNKSSTIIMVSHYIPKSYYSNFNIIELTNV